MRGKTTLSTIAAHLGVSTATVSLALRDSPLVAETTREKIKESARELGYIYNRRAASLRTSRSGIIGVLMHDIMNPFFAEILLAIEDELELNRQTFLLCNHRDSLDVQMNFINTLLQFGADGVIMSPAIGTTAKEITYIEENGLPVVMTARSVEGVNTPVYTGDDTKGTFMATRHLIELGHTEIAFIGGQRETSTGRDRRAGYVAALEEARLELVPEYQLGSQSTRKSGYDTVRRLFEGDRKPTAIVCFNDLIAIGAISGLRSIDLVPGEDVSVAGYDNIAEAEITTPGLTSVWNGQQEVGKLAARAMINILTGAEKPRGRTLVPPELVIRGTTSKCPR